MAWLLVLACQGSLTFNGKPVHLASSDPPPQVAPPATRPSPPPRPADATPPPAAAPDDTADADEDEEAPSPPREAPRAPSLRFQHKPEPSEAELDRLGRACYALKAAACRELALIYLGHDGEDCGTYLTDDPNGPIGRNGRVEHEACKPPTYRHMGACGVCANPTIRCEEGKGGPWGHKDKKCPAGDLCSVYGYCFPKAEFPVEQHNLKKGKQCYVDRECASQDCEIDGMTAYGDAGNCR